MIIFTEEDEDEAGYLLNILLGDEFRSYGSQVENLLNVAPDNDEHGAAVEESNPESNPPLVVDDLPTAQSPPNNGTQPPVIESSRSINPTIASFLSLVVASSSASSVLRDEPTPDSHTEVISDVVGGTGSPRDESKRYYCESCKKELQNANAFRQHLNYTKSHQPFRYQCCCEYSTIRKVDFRRHIGREFKCNRLVPFLCVCGYKVESTLPGSLDLIWEHIGTCQHVPWRDGGVTLDEHWP